MYCLKREGERERERQRERQPPGDLKLPPDPSLPKIAVNSKGVG